MLTLTLICTGHGPKGPLYDVKLGEEVIVTNVRDPEHTAARVLEARGLAGPFQTVGLDGRLRMSFPSIAWAARTTTTEAGTRKFKPFDRARFRKREYFEPSRLT